LILAAALLLAGLGCGCAVRRVPAPDTVPQEQKYWQDCQETVPAEADGFQHFVCTDVKAKRWEVLVRRQPK
jgi:hypothetical protein